MTSPNLQIIKNDHVIDMTDGCSIFTLNKIIKEGGKKQKLHHDYAVPTKTHI